MTCRTIRSRCRGKRMIMPGTGSLTVYGFRRTSIIHVFHAVTIKTRLVNTQLTIPLDTLAILFAQKILAHNLQGYLIQFSHAFSHATEFFMDSTLHL